MSWLTWQLVALVGIAAAAVFLWRMQGRWSFEERLKRSLALMGERVEGLQINVGDLLQRDIEITKTIAENNQTIAKEMEELRVRLGRIEAPAMFGVAR